MLGRVACSSMVSKRYAYTTTFRLDDMSDVLFLHKADANVNWDCIGMILIDIARPDTARPTTGKLTSQPPNSNHLRSPRHPRLAELTHTLCFHPSINSLHQPPHTSRMGSTTDCAWPLVTSPQPSGSCSHPLASLSMMTDVQINSHRGFSSGDWKPCQRSQSRQRRICCQCGKTGWSPDRDWKKVYILLVLSLSLSLLRAWFLYYPYLKFNLNLWRNC